MYAYRLTIYAGKSVDSTESTVLTPAAGAVHSDPFRVATVPGVTGFKPYIVEPPAGRKGQINVLQRSTDVGSITVQLVDPKAGSSGLNLQRWVTAFVGNAAKLLQLKSRKAFVEECTNWDPVGLTGTWQPYFTGRVYTAKLNGRLKYAFEIRDTSGDMDSDIFVGHPDPAIQQAFMASLVPLGLPYKYGFIDQRNRIAPWLSGHIQPDMPRVVSAPGRVNIDNVPDRLRYMTSFAGGLPDYSWMVVLRDAAGHIGFFGNGVIDRQRGQNKIGANKRFATGFNVSKTPLAGSTMTAWPANGTAVTLYATRMTGPPDADIPLMVDDVHCCTMLRWILEGRFGTRVLSTGVPNVVIPHNAASFAAFEADTSLPTGRWMITKAEKMKTWIEQNILLPYGLAMAINPSGEVYLIDIRLSATSITGAVTLTSADLIAGSKPEWESGQESVSQVEATYHLDDMPARVDAADTVQGLYPSIAPIGPGTPELVECVSVNPTVLDAVADASAKPTQINVSGARTFMDDGYLGTDPDGALAGTVLETVNGMNRELFLRAQLGAMGQEIVRLFGVGAIYATLEVGRNTRTNSILVGQYVVLSVDELPDPATNVRGGGRIGLCIQRTEKGPKITLRFIDAGDATQTGAPGITSFAANTSDTRHSVDYVLTRANAADTLRLEVNITPAGQVTAPAQGDAGWAMRQIIGPSDSLSGTLSGLPGGVKIWPRVSAIRLPPAQRYYPSAYVTGTAVTLTGLTAPSGLAFSSATKNGGHLAWTPGEPKLQTDILVAAGTTAPTGLATEYLQTVAGADVQADLVGLAGPSAQQTLGVRHSDRLGSASAIATLTITTGSANTQCPRPAGISVR